MIITYLEITDIFKHLIFNFVNAVPAVVNSAQFAIYHGNKYRFYIVGDHIFMYCGVLTPCCHFFSYVFVINIMGYVFIFRG